MGKVGKSLAIALILVMAISGVSLLMVKPASAQTATPVPTPSLPVPQFTATPLNGGSVELLTPRGRKARIDCTTYRCREVIPGWYEGALYFNREQWMFTPED